MGKIFAARSQKTVSNNVARSAAIEKADYGKEPFTTSTAWPLLRPVLKLEHGCHCATKATDANLWRCVTRYLGSHDVSLSVG